MHQLATELNEQCDQRKNKAKVEREQQPATREEHSFENALYNADLLRLCAVRFR
jgi:hypothetical protein